jgi:hypothetical protein
MTTVAEIFEQQQAYAAEVGTVVSNLATALENLASVEVTVTDPPDAEHTFYDAVSAIAAQLVGAAPGAPIVALPTLAVPTPPSISFSDVESVIVPDLTITPPAVTIPAAPALPAVTPPVTAAPFEAVPIPDAPTLTIPTVPTLTQINLPAAPTLDLPVFAGTAPAATFSAPSNNFAFAEVDYSSALLDEVKAKLLTDLEDGGYGIDDDDETRLVDRALERENAQAAASVDEAERLYATRRFPVPPGAMYGAIERARQSAQEAISTASRDIHVKRSDLYVQNRQFTLEQAKGVEGILINYHASKQERLLNAAKYVAQFAIDFFTAQKEAYVARLEGYKAEAAVFESRVRGEVEKLNAVRVALEIEKTKGDIDRNRLEAYRLQLSGLETQVNLYRTRMQAAEVQASIERIRLEAYRATVEAYVATVKGKELEFQAFESAIRGEEAKARIYETQVRGYSASVEGAKVRADVARTRFQAELEGANAQIALYNADNLRYRTEWSGAVDGAKLDIEVHRGAVDAFRARAGAVEALGRLGVANYEANSRDFASVLRHSVEKAQIELKVGESNRAHQTNTTAKLLDFYTQTVVAALSGINALATQSTSE